VALGGEVARLGAGSAGCGRGASGGDIWAKMKARDGSEGARTESRNAEGDMGASGEDIWAGMKGLVPGHSRKPWVSSCAQVSVRSTTWPVTRAWSRAMAAMPASIASRIETGRLSDWPRM
jgi:hypothetical protein